MVHVDVADGHFVPELTVGQPVIKSLAKATELELDVHLLVERPERFVPEFVAAGAARVAVHVEATRDLHGALRLIRERGAKAGVALLPGTPVAALDAVLGDLDFVNVLTADASSSGAPFLESAPERIREVAQARTARRLSFEIEAEGGIGPERIEELARAGADILVAGSAIFVKDDPQARLVEMIRAARVARHTLKV